jgi:IS605 OrfB family transposase
MSEGAVVEQAYRFALAPSPEQERFLGACAGASRFWFHQGLALVKARLDERETAGADEEVGVPWSYKALCTAFKGDAAKDELAPWRTEVVTGSYQAGLEALGRALQNFSAGRACGRREGFPQFRRKGQCNESIIFQRPRLPDSRHVDLDRRLGPLRTKESMRKLARLLQRDEHARVLRSTVKRVNGGWTISFTVRRSAKQRQPHRPRVAVGVDVGIGWAAVLSTGEAFANARPLQAALAELRRLQRKLDRQRRTNNPGNYLADGRVRPGPKTWASSQPMLRTQERTNRLHARVANIRRQQAHAITTYITREYGVIGCETLAVQNLLHNRRLARHLSDVGLGMMLAQLRYKAPWAGSMLVAADRYYPSSKTCSACGAVKAKLSLAERVFTCESCGHEQDRDENAATNLAVMAHQHAQAEGIESYVARIGRFTLNARGGQVSLDHLVKPSPLKREDSRTLESSHQLRLAELRSGSERREALAVA